MLQVGSGYGNGPTKRSSSNVMQRCKLTRLRTGVLISVHLPTGTAPPEAVNPVQAGIPSAW